MEYIEINGVNENNLKGFDVKIPKNKFVVVTGVSGSGKSSLAFDTIYAEGQRKYIESLSSYARQFLGMLEKPDVKSISGLSPAISIEQKTTSNNPRSTVGTVTEIYDFLRLLYSKIGIPHCPYCGRVIESQSIDQIVSKVSSYPEGSKIQILAPVVKGEKGEHKALIAKLAKSGFIRLIIDGELHDINFDEINLEKNKKHTIEVLVDRLVIKEGIRSRLAESIETAMEYADGSVIIDDLKTREVFSSKYSCPEHNFSFIDINPRLFSFNAPTGACEACLGIGHLRLIDYDKIFPDTNLTLYDGVKAFGASTMKKGDTMARMYFESIGEHYGVKIRGVRIKDLPKEFMNKIAYGTGDEEIHFKYSTSTGVREFDQPFEGVIPTLQRRYMETKSDSQRRFYELYMSEKPCNVCNGKRLKKEVLYILVGDLNIHAFTELSIIDAEKYITNLSLSENEMIISEEILKEIKQRLNFLINVGLGYLTLSRAAGTLSGGESQRIRLAAQIGSGLSGVIYVLDEPSIGLHQRDNDKLLKTLRDMKELGNTLIVVEHDEDTIRSADHIIDIGPVAGERGGHLIAEGTPEEIIKVEESITGQYLSGKKEIPVPKERRKGNRKKLKVIGAKENNLKNVDLSLPLGTLTCITGVSGSGKSSLINSILYKGIYKELNGSHIAVGEHKDIRGIQHLDKIIAIDQSPIGRTPRSNPATYTGVFDVIRDVFQNTNESKMRGYTKGRFSFNVPGGRCESCKGDGVKKIEMHFLSDVYVPCEVCNGKRYNTETLEVKYKGHNISDVLSMTVNTAYEVFENIPKIRKKLEVLIDVGLGYIRLGQSSVTLSGGEAQRVKLATELSKVPTGKTLYVLDEPTTGLHTDDVSKLIKILDRLVESGNSAIVIEHNLDLIKSADYIVDLGPEGGVNGGEIIAEGTPEEVSKVKGSYTGKYLKELLK